MQHQVTEIGKQRSTFVIAREEIKSKIEIEKK